MATPASKTMPAVQIHLIVLRAKAYQRFCLLQGPSLAEKALQAAEALKARTEEAAERAKEGLKSAAGTAREAAQRAAGTTQGAAQQAKESAAEGARTTEQTVAQDAERVTGVFHDRSQEPHPEAQQAPAQVHSPAAWAYNMPCRPRHHCRIHWWHFVGRPQVAAFESKQIR